MGEFISSKDIDSGSYQQFKDRLRRETLHLSKLMENGHFQDKDKKIGMEIEGWLLDKDGKPAARNAAFLSQLNDPLVVPELSQYNFEINTPPVTFEKGCLLQAKNQLQETWDKINQTATSMDLKALIIGSLPSLQEGMLDLDCMSQEPRYSVLNQQIMAMRKQRPIHMKIQGDQDQVDVFHDDVMLEAASTSIQVHLQVPLESFVDYYNASLLASPFTVAAAANAPFVFGKDLWEETRIPVFEKSLALPGFQDVSGHLIQRVTFGSGFLRESPIEAFLENLDGYPILIPSIQDADPKKMRHLQLHNGTIWRWNRPILGWNDDGTPTIRIEHRVMSAGPTIVDIMANASLYLGLVEAYVKVIRESPQILDDFDLLRQNFYSAARFGLDARFTIPGGKQYRLGDYLVNHLFVRAKNALLEEGLNKDEINLFFDDVLYPRIKDGRTGARFQKQMHHDGKMDMRQLVLRYEELQRSGEAVCHW